MQQTKSLNRESGQTGVSGDNYAEESSALDWTEVSNGQTFHRANEKEQLQSVYFQTANSRLVMVHGESGVGKTHLTMKWFRSFVAQQKGLFAMGKFEKIFSSSPPQPYLGFIQALNDLPIQILRDEVFSEIRIQIKQNLDLEEMRVMAQLVPSLAQVVTDPSTEQPSQETTSTSSMGNAAVKQRFKYICRNFLRAVVAGLSDRRLVLALDDIGWADEASIDLLDTLLHDDQPQCLLVCTCEDEEMYRKILLLAEQPRDTRLSCTQIQLDNFTSDEMSEILDDVFTLRKDERSGLLQCLSPRTHGNMLFVILLLQRYFKDSILYKENGKFVWDLFEDVEQHDSIEGLLRRNMESLESELQDFLKVSACLGSNMDRNLLQSMFGKRTPDLLRQARQHCCLEANTRDHLQFTHDAVREACYPGAAFDERSKLHYNIGRSLWKYLDVDELDRHIFLVLQHLLEGECLQDDRPEESYAIARMCLLASERSSQFSCFRTAYFFVRQGISRLPSQSWRHEYILSLQLHNYATEVAYCSASLESVSKYAAIVIENARTFDDTLPARIMNIYALGSRRRLKEGIHDGLNLLARLGQTFPENRTRWKLLVELIILKRRLKRLSSSAVLRLPRMEDQNQLTVMQILNVISFNAYFADPLLHLFIGARMVNLSLKCGLSTVSCVGFATVAMILCGLGDMEEGSRIGGLSLELYNTFNAKAWFSRISLLYYGAVCGWKNRTSHLIEPLRRGIASGLETGDIESAMLNGSLACWAQLELTSIGDLDAQLVRLSGQMNYYGQSTMSITIKPAWQMLHNFAGRNFTTEYPAILTGEIISEGEINESRIISENVYLYSNVYKMVLSYSFGDYEKAEAFAMVGLPVLEKPGPPFIKAFGTLYDALTAISFYMAVPFTDVRKRRYALKRARKRLKLFRAWAVACPVNFLGKMFLVEAELAHATNRSNNVMGKYVSAIALSREGGFVWQTALACERAGRYCLARNDKEAAGPFFNDALESYERWGGTKKLEHLRAELVRRHIL